VERTSTTSRHQNWMRYHSKPGHGMAQPLQLLFLFFALLLIVVGVLMMAVPMRFPRLYAGFLRESVMRRQVTERDKTLAIRTQGLIAFTCGAFLAFFVWALR